MAKLSEIESGKFIEELSVYLNSDIIENIRSATSGNGSSNSTMPGNNLEGEIVKLEEELAKNRKEYNNLSTKQEKTTHDSEYLKSERHILNERAKILKQEIQFKKDFLIEEKKNIEEQNKNYINQKKILEDRKKQIEEERRLEEDRIRQKKELEKQKRIINLNDAKSTLQNKKSSNEEKIEALNTLIDSIKYKDGKLDTNLSKEERKKVRELEKQRKEIEDKESIKNNAINAIPGVFTGGINAISSGKMDVNAIAGKVSSSLYKTGNPYAIAAGVTIDILSKLFELYSKVNSEASKYARAVGGGAYAMQKMQKEAADLAEEMSKISKRSYDAAELIKVMSDYSTVLGRNVEHFSNLDKIELFNLKEIGISNETISQMDTFGISVSETSNRLNKVYQESGKKGLNAKAVTDQIQKNLKLAQKYTFAGGLKALTRMAEKATALKVDMSLASSFADKVSTLEGAATTGAELSVLGGSYAQVGNPLSLLYGGLQDAGKLFDDFVKMASDKAFYNKETGEYEISAFERQRMKYASNSTGINYDDFLNATMRNAQLRDIDNAIGKNYSGIDEETREYIRNIATIKNGKPMVSIKTGVNENGKDVYEDKEVTELTPLEKEALRKESEAKYNKENGTIGDVLNSTRSTQDKLDNIIKLLKNQIVHALFKIVGWDHDKEFALNEENTEKYKEGKKNSFARGVLGSMGITTDNKGKMHFNLEDYAKWLFTGGWSNPLVRDNFNKSYANADNYNRELAGKLSQSENKKYALGGLIKGNGNSTSDSIPAMLSNGEFVINAKNAQANYDVLNAINNGNGESYFKQMKVEPIRESALSKPQTMEISLKPLQINVGGEFNVKSNGQNLGNINAKEIFTQEVLVELSRQLAKTLNHGVLSSDIDNQLKFV